MYYVVPLSLRSGCLFFGGISLRIKQYKQVGLRCLENSFHAGDTNRKSTVIVIGQLKFEWNVPV
jgi:hypothetical protein